MGNPCWWASKDCPSTFVLVYHTWDKDVQQLCSRSLFSYLNGVYSVLWYPNAALLLAGRSVCLFICVYTWVCFCFLCISNIFRTPHMTGRNEAKNLTLNSRKGSLLPLYLVQKYLFSNMRSENVVSWWFPPLKYLLLEWPEHPRSYQQELGLL